MSDSDRPITICITVDVREHALFEKMESQKGDATIEKQNLPLGDIVFRECGGCGGDSVARDIIIIERKTIDDLLASIRDGRYKEQSYRLLHSEDALPPHNVIYLIEGVLSRYGADARKQVFGAITSLNYFKGFSVVRTSSIDETAELILHMAAKIQKDLRLGKCTAGGKKRRREEEEEEETETPKEQYVSAAIRKVKRNNLTPENIWEFMLSQIPFVSPAIAQNLLRDFNTVPQLCAALQTDPNCLSQRKMDGRKLSSRVVQNLQMFLLGGQNSSSSLQS